MDVCTARGPQGPACLALAMALQLDAQGAAAAEAAVGSPEAGAGALHGQAVRHASSYQVLPSTLDWSGGCTVASPGSPWPSKRLSAMLFLAETTRPLRPLFLGDHETAGTTVMAGKGAEPLNERTDKRTNEITDNELME